MARALEFGYNMTHQEIADVMGVSRQTIRMIEIRALRKINKSKILREYWNGLVREESSIDRVSDIFDSSGVGR